MGKIKKILEDYSDIKKLVRNSLDVIGIFDGEYAYRGPDCVQIDLTNKCNNNCIACWCNSPLLLDKATPPEVKEQTLDYKVVIRLLDDLARMGTREIYFSGGGEPLMHPKIMEIISYAKSKKLCCHLHTNFTLMDEDKIRTLQKIKLDHIVISLWAATGKTYCLTHPNKNADDFERIIKLLTFLNSTKEIFPHTRIYNVISNLNYSEFTQMVELGLKTQSDSVEFTVVDTIPQRTEQLLLNDQQTQELLSQCRQAKDQKRYYLSDGKPYISNYEHFVRRFSSEHGSLAEYDKGLLDSIPCYVGWLFARIIADGNVNSCLKSHRYPIGNLYQQDFARIWNGAKQRSFRKAALKDKKGSPIFSLIGNDPDKDIGCYKSCDDLGRIIFMHEKISKLNLSQKKILSLAMRLKRYQRIFLGGKISA
jgi:MoaA/NifB/PqqE/SkfB family radical SAM enzyme